MSLNAALSIANSGLANINLGLSVASQNVANASTPGYALEQVGAASLSAAGLPMGVRAGPIKLASDPFLAAQVATQGAAASAAQTTSNALATISPALGTVGAANDLGSLVGAVQGSFSALLNDPASQAGQNAVVSASQALAGGINQLSGSYATARQSAQDQLVSEVGQLNAALGSIGSLSDQIITLQAQGQSTADLQNQRNAAMTTVASLVGASFIAQPNGDMQVITAGGAVLPTHSANPLSLANATTGASTFYPGGGLPGIMMGGTDVTGAMVGGSIGANLTLRDTTLPSYQAGLDEFSQNLATRFSAQGLTLFTDPTGAVPTSAGPPTQSGYLGFSGTIEVNQAVVANPALVRDGTGAVAGSATGASAFAPNPPTGPAGFTTLITRVLDFSLGTMAQAGVPQPAPASSGLGPSGTLAAPALGAGAIGDVANALTASQAADAGNAQTLAGDAQSLQTALAGKLTGETGVSIDTEMSGMIALQNAYSANARVISTVQAMYTELFAMVQ